jgi:hypothetical protein
VESDDRFLPVLAGFLSAAVVARILVSIDRYNSFAPLFVAAAIHVALTVAANWLGIQVAGYLFSRNVAGVSRLSTPAAALLAPLIVCISSGSRLAIPLSGVMAAFATSVFLQVFNLTGMREAVSTRSAGQGEMFQPLPTRSPSELLSFVGAAMCFQGAILTGVNGKLAIPIAFVSAGSAIVSWQVVRSQAARSANRLSGKLTFSWLMLVLAIVLTTRTIRSEFGGGGDETIHRTGDAGAGGQYWGVMLWTDLPSPDAQQKQTPPISSRSPVFKGIKVPMKIKFSGVYWFFRWPNAKPPSNAAVMTGMPDKIGFHSTDLTPLVMEAHQLLPDHIDIRCCSRIEVTVRNADKYPGPLPVELLLNDSSTPLMRSFSLGRAMVGELESFQQKSRDVTLSFPIPENQPISSFNQITFRFYPEANRRSVSPRIAIRDLTLIPR